ncbi:MAG: hypothetical protein MUD01_28755 [Chloroflexaceae bacterium]|jgi:hypothetical protein|nr:hypothetical protein [Chloroflexaceae bacterium]
MCLPPLLSEMIAQQQERERLAALYSRRLQPRRAPVLPRLGVMTGRACVRLGVWLLRRSQVKAYVFTSELPCTRPNRFLQN